jgi:hypothetical protein
MRRKKHLLATSALPSEENLSPDRLCKKVVVGAPDSAHLCSKVCGKVCVVKSVSVCSKVRVCVL